MSSSVPSRLHLSGQAAGFGSPDRRTPTPSGIVQVNMPSGHNRRNSHLRSSLAEPPGSRMAMSSAMGVGSSTMGQAGMGTGRGHNEGSMVLFEWPIAGWDMLGKTSQGAGQGEEAEDEETDRPDIMRRGIIFGDGVYKVDIAADSGQDPFENTAEAPIALSIFLSCITVETAPVEYSFSTTIFAGIRPATVDVGQKYAETHWSWHCQLTHEFSRETDYARIALPDYNTVLLPQAAGEWVLVLRIACPPAPPALDTHQYGAAAKRGTDWVEPGQVTVPRDVMLGLADLLDSPSGDVQFICLEHVREACKGGDEGEERILSRKRIIYAHSEILRSRSAYFKMLLDGGFKETEGQARRTVLVDDAGYDTVYWLLRFIYCNALTFATEDDVRMITDISSLDRKAVHKILDNKPQISSRHHWSPPQPGEWDYRIIPLDNGSESGDAMSAAMSMSMTLSEADGHSVSEASAYSGGPGRGKIGADVAAGRRSSGGLVNEEVANRGESDQPGGPSRPIRPGTSAGAGIPSVPPRRGAPPSSMASASTSTPSKETVGPSRSGVTVRPGRQAASSTTGKAPMNTSPIGPKLALSSAPPRMRLSDVAPVPDPHPHPASPPPHPSALAMYLLSHRYDIPALEALARERILKGLTSEACMPMLLATHAYESLHAEVLDFVIDYFGTIQTSPQFRSAVKEVSSGQWGATGGDVLLGLFQRL